jgi:GlpG protein
MRLIGTLEHENHGQRFSAYLKQRGIENTIDPSFDPALNRFLYSVWIHNEDQIADAAAYFAQFQTNPQDHQFDLFITDQAQSEVKPSPAEALVKEHPARSTRVTSFFLALCCLVFFLNMMQILSLRKGGETEVHVTPIQALFLYDAFSEGETTPYWHGIYAWVLLKMKEVNTAPVEGAPFTSIRQGEVWRLFSPALLHADLLHILFNMLWLWMLGRQIEQRIGAFRYVILTLILGIGTNTAQYLMSGPLFLGYSGIIMGLAGFIWCREKIAPWEGYPLQKSVILFLLLFILAMFVLQLVSFLLLLFTSSTFNPNIANTAHIGGFLLGALLARASYFSARA